MSCKMQMELVPRWCLFGGKSGRDYEDADVPTVGNPESAIAIPQS